MFALSRRPLGCRDGGAVAVEFALVLPLLFMLVMGTIDFSRYYYTKSVLTSASFEGARAAALSPASSLTARVEAAVNAAKGSLLIDTPIVAFSNAGGTACSSGNTVSVTVRTSTSFQFLTPVLGSAVGSLAKNNFFKGKISATGSYVCFG